jgi:hypothetical protein
MRFKRFLPHKETGESWGDAIRNRSREAFEGFFKDNDTYRKVS